MMSFGRGFRVELFGSSHAPQVGAVIEGVPEGMALDLDALQAMLDRRRPVGRSLASRRQEEDRLVLDEGIEGGVVVGPRVRAHVANLDVRPADYEPYRTLPRPGHADYPARTRYGPEADLAGGGIFSGRMTVGLVLAGAIASQMLRPKGFDVVSFTSSVGGIGCEVDERGPLRELAHAAGLNEVGCPDPDAAEAMAQAIAEARRAGDSLGGLVETRADGLPVGLGEPFFDSLESEIAHLAFSVPAVKGIEFGAGFAAARMRGSEHNDPFYWVEGAVRTRTNHAGGILGGLSNGMPLRFRVAVKPTSSIARPQETVDLARRTPATLVVRGRHDPCIVPRAVVVLESITWIALADLARTGGFAP